MKRKTWIVSALMYTLVFLVCFGVLHFFKKITTAIDSTEYTTETGADTDIVIDGTDNDADPDKDHKNGKNDGNGEAGPSGDTEETQDEIDGKGTRNSSFGFRNNTQPA